MMEKYDRYISGNNKDLKESLTKNLQSVNAWFEKITQIYYGTKTPEECSELLPNVNDFRTYSRAKNRQGEDIDSFKSYNEAP